MVVVSTVFWLVVFSCYKLSGCLDFVPWVAPRSCRTALAVFKHAKWHENKAEMFVDWKVRVTRRRLNWTGSPLWGFAGGPGWFWWCAALRDSLKCQSILSCLEKDENDEDEWLTALNCCIWTTTFFFFFYKMAFELFQNCWLIVHCEANRIFILTHTDSFPRWIPLQLVFWNNSPEWLAVEKNNLKCVEIRTFQSWLMKTVFNVSLKSRCRWQNAQSATFRMSTITVSCFKESKIQTMMLCWLYGLCLKLSSTLFQMCFSSACCKLDIHSVKPYSLDSICVSMTAKMCKT